MELGFAPQHLFRLAHSRDYLYLTAEIPKKSGEGKRQIRIPTTELKGVQRAIYKTYLKSVPPSDYAFAFREGYSIVGAAKKIAGRNGLLKVDIRDFFPSITERRVFGLYASLGFNTKVSYILTRLSTFEGCLVQGSPTSPSISNLICKTLDRDLSRFSTRWGLSYLRYSDDMFFWGPKHFSYRKILPFVERIVSDHGFYLNHDKTRYHPPEQPRYVLGLSAHNKDVAIPRVARRNMRAAFFRASRNLKWARDNLNHLSGLAEWHKCVYGKDKTYFEYQRIIRNIMEIQLHEPYEI
ncbi:reverse transcriptase domain-containing protein [Aquisalimonas lutea]|uniref:reverse transcriptase domain-containing protein n=1 Tax=Aquisalimonas lutea TaxID=1327750 RepID=UPI0025B40EFD|nr:reverse transcriptase domain-containing protein [Aquisalimonas lutea]MDN3517027.1 reverse transcriptase domain-containing protein [Aquisalimonas lutea]